MFVTPYTVMLMTHLGNYITSEKKLKITKQTETINNYRIRGIDHQCFNAV
jgi:hypothetical protein